MHHVPSLFSLLHTTSSYCRTPVETYYKNIHHTHLCDECMIIVFCHQLIHPAQLCDECMIIVFCHKFIFILRQCHSNDCKFDCNDVAQTFTVQLQQCCSNDRKFDCNDVNQMFKVQSQLKSLEWPHSLTATKSLEWP